MRAGNMYTFSCIKCNLLMNTCTLGVDRYWSALTHAVLNLDQHLRSLCLTHRLLKSNEDLEVQTVGLKLHDLSAGAEKSKSFTQRCC